MRLFPLALRPVVLLLVALFFLLFCAPAHARAGPLLRFIRACRQARAERLAARMEAKSAAAGYAFAPADTTAMYVPTQYTTNLADQVNLTAALAVPAEQYVTVPSDVTQVSYAAPAARYQSPAQYGYAAPPRQPVQQVFYMPASSFFGAGDCPGGVCPPSRGGLFRRGW